MENYPFVAVPDALHECVVGWDKIAAVLRRAIAKRRSEKPILVADCYPGVDESVVLSELQSRLAPKLTIHAADAYHSPEKIENLVAPFLRSEIPPTELPPGAPEPPGARSPPSPPRSKGEGRREEVPRVQGATASSSVQVHRKNLVSAPSPRLSLVNFFNAEPLWRLRRTIEELKGGLVLIVGCGASLIAWGHILVYADLARREARQRLRSNENGNIGADNKSIESNSKCKRARFVDWAVTDRWKRPLIKRWDYVLDTNNSSEPKLADAEDVRCGLHAAARRPLRVVLREGGNGSFSSSTPRNSRWSFARVLEENSLLLGFGDVRLELPAIDLLFNQPHALLGEAAHARFGDEFPIPFDFLAKKNLANRFEPFGKGDGWREERAVLLKGEIVEIRRHRFSKTVAHDTYGGVNILNLVEGDEAIVESPDGAFEPLVVHHAKTFIVPAAVGRYHIRPHGPSAGKEIATIKAIPKIP